MSATSLPWIEIYKAAVIETDRIAANGRILQAQSALVLRGRELFLTPGNEAELSVLDAALNSLDALRRCQEATAS